MKLKFLFLLIVVYVLAGFGWWTYSLLLFSNDEYKMKTQLLRTGQKTCELKVVEMALAKKFTSNACDTFFINDVKVVADTTKLNAFVEKMFLKNYTINYSENGDTKRAVILINTATLKQLAKELRLKKRSFTVEALLLTLLIGVGLFGVYFSVNMVFELNKQQNNFLLSVTHELKTPIAAIKLLGETIKIRVLPKEKQEELLENILENASRLQDLTENMLTAMQMENNRYNLRKEPLNLSDLVNEVKKNFALKNEIRGEVLENVMYYGDLILLKMSLNNLVENAIKYSNNQSVEINFYKSNQELIIEIKDQGIGINPRFRKKIFKKFYRLQDDETRDTKGSGLGLFIVKQAVEKHKGKINVAQNIPKGSIFTLSFPDFI